MKEPRVFCQVCLSTLKPGDVFCSSCGSVVPENAAKPPGAEVRGRIAGERKYLTVLCADLQRSTDLISELDPEAAISRLEPALIALRTAVRRNRGIVSKEGGDGLIALFGAPHADDNHALMACYAAVELVNRIKLLDDPALQVRVGVHSGYVVAHVIEADFSSIYEAGGPAVHLVKRLESAALGGPILVSESCHNLCSGLVKFNALPPQAAGRIFGARSLLRDWRDQRIDALAGPFDQGAFVVCRPRGRDFPAGAGRARCRCLRTARRAGRHRGYRKIPNRPRVRRWLAAAGLAGAGGGMQPAGASRSLRAAEEDRAERAGGGEHRRGRI